MAFKDGVQIIRTSALLSISFGPAIIVLSYFHTSEPSLEEGVDANDDAVSFPLRLPGDLGLLCGLELLRLLGVASLPRHHFRNSSKVMAFGSFGRTSSAKTVGISVGSSRSSPRVVTRTEKPSRFNPTFSLLSLSLLDSDWPTDRNLSRR